MGAGGKEETQLVILETPGWRPPTGLCSPSPNLRWERRPKGPLSGAGVSWSGAGERRKVGV